LAFAALFANKASPLGQKELFSPVGAIANGADHLWLNNLQEISR